MDKSEFFLRGMQEGKYRSKPWVMRAFAIVRETKTVEEVEPLDIIQTPAGFFYKGEDNKLVPITSKDFVAGKPMLHPKEKLFVKKGTLPGITQDVETDYGRILYHCMLFVYPFGDKVPFTNGVISLKKFEAELAAKLQDDEMIVGENGETSYKNDPNAFYPRELVKYYEGAAYSRGMAMYFVPAASPKALTIDPLIIKRRDEIYADPTVDMNDPVVAARVDKELVDMDRKSFEGDPASGFLISGKDFPVIRKKRFISYGSGAGLTTDSRTRYIKNSLRDGYDINHIKDYNDESRAGSYKRGVETMFGGELDKWLVRASSNILVTEDCGTMVGVPTTINIFNQGDMVGKYIVNGKEPLLLTNDNLGTYMGKTVLRRSPSACHSPHPDYCKVCLGSKLSMNPDAISIAFSQYGHAFMGESMSAMHGKALSVQLMDFYSEVS